MPPSSLPTPMSTWIGHTDVVVVSPRLLFRPNVMRSLGSAGFSLVGNCRDRSAFWQAPAASPNRDKRRDSICVSCVQVAGSNVFFFYTHLRWCGRVTPKSWILDSLRTSPSAAQMSCHRLPCSTDGSTQGECLLTSISPVRQQGVE